MLPGLCPTYPRLPGDALFLSIPVPRSSADCVRSGGCGPRGKGWSTGGPSEAVPGESLSGPGLQGNFGPSSRGCYFFLWIQQVPLLARSRASNETACESNPGHLPRSPSERADEAQESWKTNFWQAWFGSPLSRGWMGGWVDGKNSRKFLGLVAWLRPDCANKAKGPLSG